MATTDRNAPCPCGSGKKYKKCCMGKAASAAPEPRDRPAAAADALMRDAWTHQQAGKLYDAAAAYSRLLDREPDHAAAQFGLGQVLGRLGQTEKAIEHVRASLAGGGKLAAKHAKLASLLLEQLRPAPQTALEHARQAVALDPANLDGHVILAKTLERLNLRDEAVDAAKAALAIDPGRAKVGLLVARLERRAGALDAARGRLDAILDGPALPPAQRSDVLNELGFVLDGLGEYDASFDAFTACGKAALESPATQRVDRDLLSREITDYAAGVTPDLLRRWSRTDLDDGLPAPAFLVGFPRSGTTMTEQALAAHPSIVTSDEDPIIHVVRHALDEMVYGEVGLAEKLGRLDGEQVGRLRALYWREAQRCAGASDLGDRTFLDKNPLNIIHLGLISTLFPDARVIVALRDPRDVCLSCFMQHFQANAGMVHFLSWERTAACYDEVMGLWLHLRDMLTVPFIEVRYEDTVADLEGQLRRILDLLGLPWHGDVLRFHEIARNRAISTPSFEAVTRKVNARAIGRWKRHAKRVETVMPSLRRYLGEWGYDDP